MVAIFCKVLYNTIVTSMTLFFERGRENEENKNYLFNGTKYQ